MAASSFFSQECLDAYAGMNSHTSQNDFVVCKVPEERGADKQVTLCSTGRGGLHACVDALRTEFDSSVAVVVFRVTTVESAPTRTPSARCKLVHVTFVGKSVAPMFRARVNAMNAQLKAPFSALCTTYIQVAGGDLSELDESSVQAKLRGGGGSATSAHHQQQNVELDFMNRLGSPKPVAAAPAPVKVVDAPPSPVAKAEEAAPPAAPAPAVVVVVVEEVKKPAEEVKKPEEVVVVVIAPPTPPPAPVAAAPVEEEPFRDVPLPRKEESPPPPVVDVAPTPPAPVPAVEPEPAKPDPVPVVVVAETEAKPLRSVRSVRFKAVIVEEVVFDRETDTVGVDLQKDFHHHQLADPVAPAAPPPAAAAVVDEEDADQAAYFARIQSLSSSGGGGGSVVVGDEDLRRLI